MNIIDSNILQQLGAGKSQMLDNASAGHFTFGAHAIDTALAGEHSRHGLPLAQLHEIHTAEPEDSSSAAATALLLAARARIAAQTVEQPIAWIRDHGEARRQGRLYPPGLIELGLNPEHILYIDAADSIAVLRAAADAVRCAPIGAVIVELTGKNPKGLDLTATRRLALSAKKSSVTTFMLRNKAAPMPSAAYSRWQVAAAPSKPLAANAVGAPVFDLILLRHRGGLDGLDARLEWNRETQSFQEASDIGAIPTLSGIRTDHKNTSEALSEDQHAHA
ncbi:MAG: hypothetical protein ABJO01_11100 [Parasphingorhabdus sp.]|uniref:ImuA family protein n=1 Tax=Parasphingorhabdus sp. TaxID=2709688 RepID=UPI00329781DE